MKANRILQGISLLLLTFLGLAPSVIAARTPPLRYHFDQGETNIYKLEIEIRGENGTEGLAGNLLVIPKAGASNVICLGPQKRRLDSTIFRRRKFPALDTASVDWRRL